MQVFLIRHPRPLVEAGICYGQLDVAAEDPQPHAARLSALLPADIAVISSPLQRAQNLAAALQPQARLDARLMEIAFGDWEGLRWADIERTQLDAWAADVLHFTPPGGESAATLQARAVDCAGSLARDALADRGFGFAQPADFYSVAEPNQPPLPSAERSRSPLPEQPQSPSAERSQSPLPEQPKSPSAERSRSPLPEQPQNPVAERSRSIALVTHSGVMRALLGHWLQLPVAEWTQLKFEFGRVTLVELECGKATLRYTNR